MSSTYTSTTYDPTSTMDINDPSYDASATTNYGTSTTDWDTSTSPTDYTSPDYSLSSTTQPSTSLITNPTSSSNYNVGYNEGYNDALNTTSSTGRSRYGDLTAGSNLTGSNLAGSNLASTYDDTTTYTSDDVRVSGVTGAGSLGSRAGLDTGLYGSSRWGQGGGLSSRPSRGWKGAARRMASRF
jgi:hypothetical protein